MSPFVGLAGMGGRSSTLFGGNLLAPGYTSIEDINSGASWTVWPNGGNYDTGFNSNEYYGARTTVNDGTGRVRHNRYEYMIATKFYARTSRFDTAVFQMYDTTTSSTNFNNFYGGTNPGNLYGMGVAWNQSPTAMWQTNSIHARNDMSSGNGAYFVTGGTGSRTWGFFDGGGDFNGNGQGSTNRETQSTINWSFGSSQADRQITFLVYPVNHPTYPSKVRVFVGENLAYQFASNPGTYDNIWMYSQYCYPDNSQGLFDNIQLKYRYATIPSTETISI